MCSVQIWSNVDRWAGVFRTNMVKYGQVGKCVLYKYGQIWTGGQVCSVQIWSNMDRWAGVFRTNIVKYGQVGRCEAVPPMTPQVTMSISMLLACVLSMKPALAISAPDTVTLRDPNLSASTLTTGPVTHTESRQL